MRVAIRVDASASIGAGHVMRCLALADALRRSGSSVHFVMRSLPGDLQRRVSMEGHAVSVLSAPDSADPGLGYAPAHDAEETLAALDDWQWDWVVVDHYGITADWHQRVAAATHAQILCIDDLADRELACDILVDQNLYVHPAERYTGRVPNTCRLLIGPEYALLRGAFADEHRKASPRLGNVRRLLVAFGGSDSADLTSTALAGLKASTARDIPLDVVIGEAYRHGEALEAAWGSVAGVSIHRAPTEMASFMAAADLSLGAAGVMTWERCCVGLPAAVVTLADNQVEIARNVDAAGAALYLGTAEQVQPSDFSDAVDGLLEDPQGLHEMSQRGLQLVDGLGSGRVAATMDEERAE